ncbi:MAG TPA: hypothetical protein VFP90_07335, partial [Gemmatimonadaceae bacterium]|nr:hypothetical protein [Gemmatimonadaceae bacterium]
PGCGEPVTDFFIAGTDPIATCIPPMGPYPNENPYGTPGMTPMDTSFGFPPPSGSPADTMRRMRVPPGGMVTQGAAPAPRPASPRATRDSAAGMSNPFTLPPSQRR